MRRARRLLMLLPSCLIGLSCVAQLPSGLASAAPPPTVPAPDTTPPAPPPSAPLSAWQAWAAEQRASMTATLNLLTSSSLAPGCSLQSAQAEPVTSDGRYGIPSGIVFNVGVLTLDCSRALAAATTGPAPTAGATPDTTECPIQSSGDYASAVAGWVCIGVYSQNNSDLAASYVNTSGSNVTGTLTMKGGTSGSNHCITPIDSTSGTLSPGHGFGVIYQPTASNYRGSYWSLGGSVCDLF